MNTLEEKVNTGNEPESRELRTYELSKLHKDLIERAKRLIQKGKEPNLILIVSEILTDVTSSLKDFKDITKEEIVEFGFYGADLVLKEYYKQCEGSTLENEKIFYYSDFPKIMSATEKYLLSELKEKPDFNLKKLARGVNRLLKRDAIGIPSVYTAALRESGDNLRKIAELVKNKKSGSKAYLEKLYNATYDDVGSYVVKKVFYTRGDSGYVEE